MEESREGHFLDRRRRRIYGIEGRNVTTFLLISDYFPYNCRCQPRETTLQEIMAPWQVKGDSMKFADEVIGTEQE